MAEDGGTADDGMGSPHVAHGMARCTVRVLWVHADPDLQSQVIGRLVEGQVVWVWQIEGVWWRVQDEDGLTGWSHAGYLAKVGEFTRG